MAKQLKLLSQYIKDLSFENYAAQKSELPKTQPNIHVDIKIKRKNLKNGSLEVTLLILIEAKDKITKIFLIELSYSATFSIEKLENRDDEKRLAFVDCPNIMFPFVRQILFNITQNSGLAPLTLDYVDFADIFEEKN